MSSDFTICALVFKGLISALKKELDFYKLKYNILETVSLKNHDLAVIEINKSHINKIKSIKTAEDLFIPVCDDITLRTKKDLIYLDKCISINTITDKLNEKSKIFGKQKKKNKIKFAVFIKQDKDHEIYRHEIQTAIEKKLKSFGNWDNREPADVELWGFYYKNTLKVCLRLTTIEFRQRNYRVTEREGSLRPTIAAALVALSNPKETDTFMDPMCGSGTIILERSLFSPYGMIYAGDIDMDAVNKTKENLSLAKISKNISVQNWNATQLPIEDNIIDTIITNLPWGNKYGKDININSIDEEFYLNLMKEFYRVIKPFGKIMLLTSQDNIIKNVLSKLHYTYEKLAQVKILGTWAGIYKIQKIIIN